MEKKKKMLVGFKKNVKDVLLQMQLFAEHTR
jgi:hypothetical protein